MSYWKEATRRIWRIFEASGEAWGHWRSWGSESTTNMHQSRESESLCRNPSQFEEEHTKRTHSYFKSKQKKFRLDNRRHGQNKSRDNISRTKHRPDYQTNPLKRRKFGSERSEAVKVEVEKLLIARSIIEVNYPDWLENPVVIKNKNIKWRISIDFTDLNNACWKDSHS